MTTNLINGSKEDEGGGGGGNCNRNNDNKSVLNTNYESLTSDQYKQASMMLNRHYRDEEDQQQKVAVDIFVKHLDNQQLLNNSEKHQQQRQRRSSLPADAIELTTLNGVVRRRKQQLQLQYQQQCKQLLDQQQQQMRQAYNSDCPTSDLNHQRNHHNHKPFHQHKQQQQHLMPAATKGRPLSISSISSAASSGSSSSAHSSTSSGIQSSLTRNGSINYSNEYRKNYLASIESLNNTSNNRIQQNPAPSSFIKQSTPQTTTTATSTPATTPSTTINITTSDDNVKSSNDTQQQSSSIIENALKSLNIASSEHSHLRDNAVTRAAVLAAGESQRRGFGSPNSAFGGSNGTSLHINRSLHASLRYDKNTAYRIHLMANARALLNNNNYHNNSNNTTNEDPNNLIQSCGSPISRNNSSTSSDSGQLRINFHSPRNSRIYSCKCGASRRQTMTPSSSAPLVADRTVASAPGDNINDQTSTSSSAAMQLFNKKAATLDGAACQRNNSNNDNNDTDDHITSIRHHADCPLSALSRPRRASAKLQPSPSSASNHSNTSSLFRDDGFEDDLTSTSSDHASIFTTYNRHHRLSFQGHNHVYRYGHGNMTDQALNLLRQHGEEDDEYQSCEEEFSNSHTTASTTSNLDDCSLSTTSSSILHHDQQVLDKVSLANVKQQYRRSLLLEHHQLHQQHHQQSSNQSKIQALLLPPPLPKLSHLPTVSNKATIAPGTNAANTTSPGASCASSPVLVSGGNTSGKQLSKCDDRTVNIISHMPTKSPGYWDSNLSISQRVVTEIIETERTYVDDLEQIVTGYICYLRNILKKQQQHLRASHSSITTSLNNCTASSKISDDDDKSMLVLFDDEITSATNEVVVDVDDEDDVDEPLDNSAMVDIKGNMSIDSSVNATTTTTSAAAKTSAPPTTATNQAKSLKNVQSQNMGKTNEEAMVSAIDIKKLFSNLEDIYKFNKDLLFRLEECYLNPSSVAECFVENASGFEVYTHYCTMYPQVVSTLTELMADPITAQLLKERQNELNQSLPLGAFLLKPVQRILKYHILFQSLINYTVDDESVSEKDGQLISEAFSVMTNIACHINTMKRRHEHSIRVQEVQGLLSGWHGPDLTTLGELILEDTFKLYNRPKSSRHLFLFDNVLLITKKKRDGSLCYKGHIECSNLMLIEKIEGQPLVFNTVPFDNPKALCSFQAKNLDKKRDWCLHMKEIIIKSFEVQIPVHVKDILMSLTSSGNTNESSPSNKSTSSETSRAIRAPNYLEKKRIRQLDRKK